MKTKSLALFDFDGTITTKDTLFEFIIYAKGKARFLLGMLILLPIFLLHAMRLLSSQRAKEIVLQFFFKGSTLSDFQWQCDSFVEKEIPPLVRKRALEKIADHIKEGDRIVIVSASPENWVGSWAKMHGLEWVATRLDSNNGRLTGKIFGKNCSGAEKVDRLKSYLNLSAYKNIYAYGDSKGDLPLLKLATSKFYKPFREQGA